MTSCQCVVSRASVLSPCYFRAVRIYSSPHSGRLPRCGQIEPHAWLRFGGFICLTVLLCGFFGATSRAQEPGQNVNMVSGTVWPYGDPFLERQDEPSLAVSTRNPLHLLAGANDYRTVDLNLPELDVGEGTTAPATCATPPCTGEPWVGLYMSIDGGARWQSTLLPGYPQDTSAQGTSSPIHVFTTAADPVIAAGTNGMFYYGGIAFDRGTSLGTVFVARFIDLNNKENGNIAENSFPIRYIKTVPVAYGTNSPSDFLDKPWIATDIPRGSATCSLSVTQADGTMVQQNIPAGNVYVAYANVATSSTGVQTSMIYFSRSTNCGATWSAPIAISKGYAISQGVTIQIDPETGIVYVAWRVIHNTPTANDAIAITASLNGGQSFLPALTVVSLPPFNANNPAAHAFFDQGTTIASFRTTAYPALAVGDSGIPLIPGPLYLAWSQRGEGPNGEARIMMLAVPGNAGVSSSGFEPPTPFPIDNGAVTNDLGGTFPELTAGHQVMPMMAFNQGHLMVVYYDLRQDHTIGEFAPNVSDDVFVPDANGNFFEETRESVEEFPTSAYTPYFIDDAGLTVRRHTMDLVLAQANAGYTVPTFNYVRVTHYDFGLLEGEASTTFQQLKFDPPNLPMFEMGEAAFMGDYIGITGQPFVLVQCGSSPCWTYNNPSPAGVAGTKLAAPKPAPASAVNYATWTSNQDVIPPPDGVWDTYTAIASGPSVYSPSQNVPGCSNGFEGDRNQNVYMSRISQGLLVTSPQVSKPLSSKIERGFVILVQNATSGRSTPPPAGFVNYFRLTIANQPVNGFASFAQFVPPSPVPSPPFPTTNNGITFPLTSVDVAIAPHTGVARTVFAVSSSPTASILVNVNEISGLGGSVLSGGMSSFLLLNADGTVPAGLVDPNGETGSNSITDVELYNPSVTSPSVTSPSVTSPSVTSPSVTSPSVTSPSVTSPSVTSPSVTSPSVTSYDAANPSVTSSGVAAPSVTSAPLSDGTYTLTNTGNTNASYNVSVTGTPPGTPLQLLLSQIYMTPQTNGMCELITQQQDITLSNVPNVPIITPGSSLPNPSVTSAPVTEPTISLGPGDTAYITLRGNVNTATMQQILTQVAPVIQPQAVNSNSTTTTTPPISAPVFITTASLPDAVVGKFYTATVQVIGGQPPYQNWLAGNLPGGLTTAVSSNTTTLTISGTPTPANLPGTPVTFEVSDSEQGAAQQTATRTLTLRIGSQLVPNPFTLSPGVQGLSYGAFTFTATGGIAPLTWQLQSGNLDGLVLSSNGTLSGTPTTTGSFPFVLLVTDSSSPSQTALTQGTLVVGSDVTSLLSFVTQPSNTPVSQTITPAVQVRAFDSSSAVLPGASITLSLTTGPGTLSGTLTQVTDATGTATFSNLSINAAGSGDVLTATAGSITATSNAFNITSTTPQACAPIPGAPISWYPFNGNTLDIRGGRPGTILGDFGTQSVFVPGEVGSGFKSTGEGVLISYPATPYLTPVNFTAGAWVRLDAETSDATEQILWQGDSGNADFTTTPYSLGVLGNQNITQWVTHNEGATIIGTAATGKVVATFSDGMNEVDMFSNTVLQTGVFYYVAITWNGPAAGATIWINGVADQTSGPTGLAGLVTPTNPFQIGGIQGSGIGTESFDGVIDELEIWGAGITQFQLATIYNAGAGGQCQAIWFTEVNGTTNRIGSIAPSGTNATEYTTPTANSFPYDIVAGPDGNVWFTENNPNSIGEFVALGGGAGIGEHPITSSSMPGNNSLYGALGLTSGPDGQLWFTESQCVEDPCFVGSISTGGTINVYGTPTADVGPQDITAGPDGNLWFTETGLGTHSAVARMTTAGTITEYQTPTGGSNPAAITTGADGNLWFTESAVSQIGVITTGGSYLHEFPIPPGLGSVTVAAAGTGYQTGDVVTVIQTGASGGTLVVGTVTAQGGVQNFSSTGSIGTGYSTATNLNTTGGSGQGLQVNILNTNGAFLPTGIALGPDGNVWFTPEDQNNVLEVTPGGQFTAYPVPKQGSAEFITAGPDGNVWYTDDLNSAIAQLVPSTGVTTEFPTPTASSGPWGIATGPAVIAVPAAPTGLTGTSASNGAPNLSWSASPSTNVAGYNVYRAPNQGGLGQSGPFTLLNATPFLGTNFTDTTGTTCSYYLYGVTTVGTSLSESLFSNMVSIQVVPSGGC
jgi:streptogramin lyase